MAERDKERIKELIKVELTAPDSFTKIKNLLKRVGVNPRNTNNVFQTCHILREGNDFYICHFKELFWIDGRERNMDQLDYERRNRIIALLVENKLIQVDTVNLPFTKKALNSVFIVPYANREEYILHPKYRFKKLKRIIPTDGSIN
jgi:hypothetical protein